MNVCESLVATARLFPHKVAVIFNDQRITYAELDELSRVTAQLLSQADIGAGDRVALMLPNTPSFIAWYYGALRIGSVVVSVSTRLADSEAAFVLEDSAASALVASQEKLAALSNDQLKTFADDFQQLVTLSSAEASPGPASAYYDADPNTAALILYTSGTTGFAKGATLSHSNVRSNVAAFNHLCNMRPHDTILLAVPLFHCFGQNALLNSALNVAATLVLQEKFDLNETKKLIATHQVTQLYGVPMMFQLLHSACEPSDLSSVSYCFSAAATLPVPTSRDWQSKFKLPIHEGYGLTETSPFACYNHRERFKLGSIGTPIDAVEMKVVDTETGEQCAPGELGEIAIRGPNVMLGYWNRPEETAAAIRNGWFHSGDIGRMDEEGFFYIVDRVKDMIAVGGLKVFPAEVERVMLDHPSISQVAVVGIPDNVFGERVIAFVVLTDEMAAAEAIPSIAGYAKENLGNYKTPREIIPIAELPRNPSGKVLKTKLRELASETGRGEAVVASDHVAATTPTPRVIKPPTLRNELSKVHKSEQKRLATGYVADLVKDICGLAERPDSETRFLDAGLDSLMIVEMSAQIQAEVGAETPLPATLVFDCPRIVDLADFVLQAIAGEPASVDAPPTMPRTEDDLKQIESMSEEEALTALLQELDE